jgi:glycerophosphoryl diester phosphodiesterase
LPPGSLTLTRLNYLIVPEIQGHRGARALRPENTIPGLAHALAIGVDAIEFDVTRTADGGLILAHDLTVDKQTMGDTGYVGQPWRSLTLAEIASLDAGDRRPATPYEETFEAVPGTGVPTLDQVCRLINEAGAHEVTLSVELKTHPSWPDAEVRRLTESALGRLTEHRLTGQARILGFDWRVLRYAEAAAPAVPRVALVEPTTWLPGSAWQAGLDPADYGAGPATGRAGLATGLAGTAEAARDIGATWLSPWDPMTTPELITAAREYGLATVPWTVNDPARMAELIGLKVAGIVTDYPDLLRQVLASHGISLPPPVLLPWASGTPDWAPRTMPGPRTQPASSPRPD